MPTQAIAYTRVSTAQQGRSGLGLEAQVEAINQFAAREGFEIVEQFIEVETGKGSDALDRRPKLAAAIKAARKIDKSCPVIVAELDRLSRDVHFISGLMTHKVPFVVAALGTNVPPFMLHVYAAFAEDREISRRTKDGLAKSTKKLGGLRPGTVEIMREASERAEAMRPLMAELAGLSHNACAKELNRRAVPTPNGKEWSAVTVIRLRMRLGLMSKVKPRKVKPRGKAP
jgi:DNA invertase Pin-like site-specific DNA recombinase